MRFLRTVTFGILVEVIAAAFFLLFIGVMIETGFYQRQPVDAITYIQWLLFSAPDNQISPFNMAFVQVLVAWLMGGFIAGGVAKKLSAMISGLLSGLTVWLLFLILAKPFPTYPWEVGSGPFLTLILSTLTPIIGFSATKLRKPRGFFQRLEEGGIHVPEHLRGKVEVPLVCPSCNEKVFSNAEYCWNCKTKLQKGSTDA